MNYIHDITEDKKNNCFRFRLHEGIKYKIYFISSAQHVKNTYFQELRLTGIYRNQIQDAIISFMTTDNPIHQTFQSDNNGEYLLSVNQWRHLGTGRTSGNDNIPPSEKIGGIGISKSDNSNVTYCDFLFELPNCIIRIEVDKSKS